MLSLIKIYLAIALHASAILGLRVTSLRRTRLYDDSLFDFLTLRDSFYDCPDPTVLDGNRMGITSIEAVKQLCVTDGDKCTYFQWNMETGSLYLCKQDDYVKAEPRLGWMVGIKPTAFSKLEKYKVTPNAQAVCGRELGRRVVSSIQDAAKRCEELNCEYFTVNLNKAAAIGPAVAPQTAWFCSGRYCCDQQPLAKTKFFLNKNVGRSVCYSSCFDPWDYRVAFTGDAMCRPGFLTMDRLTPQGGTSTAPSPPASIKVPCGLNGPVCSNDYVEGHQQGDIMGDNVHKLGAT